MQVRNVSAAVAIDHTGIQYRHHSLPSRGEESFRGAHSKQYIRKNPDHSPAQRVAIFLVGAGPAGITAMTNHNHAHSTLSITAMLHSAL